MIKKDMPLKEVLKLGEKCDRCGNCCKHGSGFLIDRDLDNIAHFLGITQTELKLEYLDETEQFNTKLYRPKLKKKDTKPFGVCVFFDDKIGCRIHSVKPLQCKVNNCGEHGEALSQWLLLNYAVNENDPESIRQWAIYLKFNNPIPGGELNNLVKDKEKLKKILSFEVLK